MSVAQVRPTFNLETTLTAEQIMSCVRKRVHEDQAEFGGQFTRHHAMISITESKRHFWSPWLNLDIREHESGREIFGRFSPHPSLWTAFVFSWLAIAVLIFFSAIFGVSQQMARETPWGYYLIPVLIFLAIALWIGSQAGQRLAYDEMSQMKAMIQQCVANHG